MASTRTLLYETVLHFVKTAIADGTYAPGERLPSVTALAAQLGVGVSTVREGIRVLESLGLVRVRHGRGTYVSDDPRLIENPLETFSLLEDSSLLSLLEARKILEPEIAALAAERAKPKEAEAIMQTVIEMRRQSESPGGNPLPADMEFHRLVLKAAKNVVLGRMMQAVDQFLLDSRRRTLRIEGSEVKAASFHYLIARAIKRRDADRARALMLEHILDVNEDVLGTLHQHRDDETIPGQAP